MTARAQPAAIRAPELHRGVPQDSFDGKGPPQAARVLGYSSLGLTLQPVYLVTNLAC